MTPELAYFLKINVAIALFYAFYRLFFHKDTFFHWRRIALLCFFAISLLYPLLNIEGWIKAHEPMVAMADLYATIILPEQVVTIPQETEINWQELIKLLTGIITTDRPFLPSTRKYHATAFSMFQKPIERSACTPIKERSRTVLFFSLDIHTPTVTYRL